MSNVANQSAPPTVLGQLILLIVTSWGAYYLHAIGRAGAPPALLASIVLALMAVLAAVKLLGAIDRVRDRVRRHRTLESFADAQGDAKIGGKVEAEAAGLLGPEGIVLGRIGNSLMRYPGEAGVLVAGRPGSWKGVAFVILNLLLGPRPTKDKFQSYIVTDISGELYSVCARRLRELGYRVLVIAPEWKRLSRELGVSIESVLHNPACYLDPEEPNIVEDIGTFIHLLHPGVEPSKQNGTTEHFDDLARLVLTTFSMWLLVKYGEVTLPGLRRCVMSTSEEMHCLLEDARDSGAFGGALAESASSVLSLMINSAEEFSGAITTATRAVKLFNAGGPVGLQVSENNFRWGQLKEEPIVVFIIVPPERLKSQAQFLNLTISTSAEALARHRSHQRVTYLLDEVGNLYIPNILPIVSLYRKFGIQVIFVLQQLESQLARIYGKEAVREIQTNCEVAMTLSMTDLEDLKRLSEMIGQETVANGSHTLRERPADAPEFSYSGQYLGRPVMRPEAIRLLKKSQALVLYANAPAFVVDLVNYLHDPKLRRLADENPYYKKR